MLSAGQEAIVVAFRRHTPLALGDCLYALPVTIPHLSRSALHRCFQRHAISRLPLNEAGQRLPMSRTIKAATVQHYHCQTTDESAEHLQAFLRAYNHAKRLKTRRGLTPHEFDCAQWQNNPTSFTRDPTHLTHPGTIQRLVSTGPN